MIAAVRDAPNTTSWAEETFATADVFDERGTRYLGLTTAALPNHVTSGTLIVRPDVASGQIAETPAQIDVSTVGL